MTQTKSPKTDSDRPGSRANERGEMLRQRKAYQRPIARCLGNVERTILSPSPGTFESGNGAGFKP